MFLEMVPEIGHFALILALCLSCALMLLPSIGCAYRSATLMSSARPLAVGFFVMTLLSYMALTLSFINDDFSVSYVAANSNSLLPIFYKISAVWGAHEGSLLLWVLMLGLWSFLVTIWSRQLPLEILSIVLATMGFISVGFIVFMLLTSNPFIRLLPIPPADGSDLNPLLQDPGLIFHPPILYMGYVGFSVAFAFAIAALVSGRFDSSWARWTRPWTTAAWVFMTLGIALGSWWAYNELGWGGWWFWDPVENASLMPWLVGTALIHSLAVTEKRGIFKSWTLLLAIFAFSLSLLGTFIVRSGVITSVHSFASDSTKGQLILGFLVVVVGASLILYVMRAPSMKSFAKFTLFSRESFLLGNNIILMIMMVAVLLGTLFPVIANGLHLGMYSIGEGYYNKVFVIAMTILSIFMGIGVLVLWRKTDEDKVLRLLFMPKTVSVVLALALPVIFHEFNGWASLTIFLGLWIITTLLVDIKQKLRNAKTFVSGLKKLPLSYFGMVIAHLGVALTIWGAGLATIYEDKYDVRIMLNQTHELNGYEFTLNNIERIEGPNYFSDRATVSVSKNGRSLGTLYPEYRHYPVRKMSLKEVAIRYHVLGDLYVIFAGRVEDKASPNTWAMGFYFKPFVTWIWIGCLLMALGGFMAIADKRYRKKIKTKSLNLSGGITE